MALLRIILICFLSSAYPVFAGDELLHLNGKLIKSSDDPDLYMVRTNTKFNKGQSEFGAEIKNGPDKDFIFSSKSIPPKEFSKLIVRMNSGLDVGLNIRKSLVSVREAMDLHSDCTEKPLDYSTLSTKINATEIHNQMDFINSLPKGTLQTFALNYDSHSLQKPAPGTDKSLYPRVIRTSEDGKLTISYVCDPKSESYNKVEVIRYDDASASFKFSEVDFNKTKRIEEAPHACASCHAPESDPTSLRPNWPKYPQWDHFYGSHDDSYKPNLDAENNKEKKEFLRFRTTQKDNPCYSSLPWPKDPDPSYAYYPFSEGYKGDDYHLRPNLKITEIYARLEAKRLAAKLKKSPKYDEVKYLIAAESIKQACGFDLPKEMAKHFPSLPLTEPDFSRGGGPNHKGAAFNLYRASKMMGIADMDWTLNIGEPESSEYAAAIAKDRDTASDQFKRIGDVQLYYIVQAEVMRDIARENKVVSQSIDNAHGVAKDFGEKFACIDDMGGEVVVRDEDKLGKLCDTLIAKQKEIDESMSLSCLPDAVNKVDVQTLIKALKQDDKIKEGAFVSSKPKEEQIQAGGQIASTVCVSCHDANSGMKPSLLFLSSPERLKSSLKNPLFRTALHQRLESTDPSVRMPMGSNLSPEQINDVEQYFESIK